MKFKRGYITIRLIKESKEKCKSILGWLSDDGEFGFHKNEKNLWIATDLASGMRICSADTRKACAEKVEELMEKILFKREEDKYKEAVAFMEDFKKNLDNH